MRHTEFAANLARVGELALVAPHSAVTDHLEPPFPASDDVQAIGDIRRLLGDEAHTLLRTVPRRGYLLDAQPVDRLPAAARAALPPRAGSGPSGDEVAPPSGGSSPGVAVRHWRAWPAVLVALALVFAAGAVGLLLREAPIPQRSLAILPFESDDPASADAWFVASMGEGTREVPNEGRNSRETTPAQWRKVRVGGHAMLREPPSALAAEQRLALGEFVLDVSRGELLDARGRPAALRAQALKLLLVLGDHAGQVVSKDELQRRVWGDVIVTEDSIDAITADVNGDNSHAIPARPHRRGPT
jgi:DNA-binding winged helix-turn-helix (wHTH) protein